MLRAPPVSYVHVICKGKAEMSLRWMRSSYKAFDGERNGSPGSYIGRIVLTGVPKLIIIMFSVIVAAYISELLFTTSAPSIPSAYICYRNPAANQSDHRICHNGVAAAVSSILVSMMLLTFDTFIPCLNKMFKRLAHLLSLLLSIIMIVYLLVTSALLANLYKRYCESVECGDDEMVFIILPFFGFLIMTGWGVVGVFSFVQLTMCI